MDRGAWETIVHRVANSGIRLSDFHFQFTKDIIHILVPDASKHFSCNRK